MAEEQHSFTLQEIVEAAVAGATKVALKEFTAQLEQRGVTADVINAAIDGMAGRISEFRQRFEGTNLVETMIEWKKEKSDGHG